MRTLLVQWAAFLLKMSCQPRFKRFYQALQSPKQSQEILFRRLVHSLSESAYGQYLGIQAQTTYIEFKEKVPLVQYEQLLPWIEQLKQGKGSVFTTETTLFFEKTSGSTSSAKYIPYTKTLKNSFHSLFKIWTFDLLSSLLTPKTGRLFISISPLVCSEKKTEGGLAIGVEDDRSYLSLLFQRLLHPFVVMPPKWHENQNFDEVRHLLALLLLQEELLEVISIWSPSYLLVILEYITLNRHQLKACLPSHRRELLSSDKMDWSMVWPNLKLISCWTSSTSSLQARRLQRIFPKVIIQGKGLLATEAPLTVPLAGAPASVPLLDEVFFEFKNEKGEVLRLHELEDNHLYEMIITQKGGLYRYCLGDFVQVKGRHYQTPCLEFVGRISTTSDMVGEKLHESVVTAILQEMNLGLTTLLVPQIKAEGPSCYVLLTERLAKEEVELIESKLCAYFHYRQARLLGQLGPIEELRVPQLTCCLHNYFVSKGMVWGNIKDRLLITDLQLATELMLWCKTAH
jgi:hypothetical protein